MPIQKQCEIREMKPLTADIFSMVFDAGEMAKAAQPGQFVHIRCGEGNLLRRPISICDAWEDNLRIVFQVRGTGTDWLAKRTVGETLDVLGPLGNGFDLSGDKPVLLVGGGIGTAPMCFAARLLGDRCQAAVWVPLSGWRHPGGRAGGSGFARHRDHGGRFLRRNRPGGSGGTAAAAGKSRPDRAGLRPHPHAEGDFRRDGRGGERLPGLFRGTDGLWFGGLSDLLL